VDLNLTFDMPTQMFGKAVDVGADLNFNRKLGFETVFIDPISGATDRDEYVGEFGFPEWEGQGILRVGVGKYRFTWSTRYISGVAQDPLGVDPYSDVFGSTVTCLGPTLGDVQCRDVGYADHYYRHDASLYYYGDVWTFGAGVRNLLNEWPPQVDSSEVAYVYNNTPMGRGYDVQGRTVFLNIVAAFQ
jgi:iron complex outermembrane receptor protein